MPRPISARVDLPALRHNLTAARARAGGRKVWAVAKANAYGHGIERAVRAFAAADGLALLDLDEAQRARDAGWTRPILLLEGVFEPADIGVCRALGLSVVLHGAEQLRLFETAAAGATVPAWVKLNTGMNRLGFAPQALAEVLARVRGCGALALAGVCMHFANADRADRCAGPAAMDAQLARFDAACADRSIARCVSNSAALFLHDALDEAWVRPGIALYGAAPDDAHAAADFGLRPAMHLTSRIIAVQSLAAGDAVGYGSRFVAPRAMRVGIVACGYADGYPRHAPDGTPVAVDGVVVPIAGRVSMDMISVDLSAAPAAQVGSAVELWGGIVPIDAVARRAGTVGYELMCALAPRVPVEVTEVAG